MIALSLKLEFPFSRRILRPTGRSSMRSHPGERSANKLEISSIRERAAIPKPPTYWERVIVHEMPMRIERASYSEPPKIPERASRSETPTFKERAKVAETSISFERTNIGKSPAGGE